MRAGFEEESAITGKYLNCNALLASSSCAFLHLFSPGITPVVLANSAETDPLQRATAAIAFRLGSPISLKKLAAKIAFTSSGHLSRLFKQHYGVSYRQYVQNLRLEKASRLLTETSLPVAEVAHRVGYNDVSRFGQHLKRLYGLTPTASGNDAGFAACGN